MKVGILTFHRVCNYGAVLQAYALTQAFRQMGADSELIDYENAVLKGQYGLLNRSNFGHPRSMLWDILSLRRNRIRNGCFCAFREKHLALSTQYYTDEMPPDGAGYDLVVTGSDQVWNMICNGQDSHYFLDTIDSSVRRGSYAACMAKVSLTEREREQYRLFLAPLDYISVREEQAVQLLQPLTDKPVALSPDPTFLLTVEQWEKLAVRPTERDYVFVFMLAYSKPMLDNAFALADKLGCRLICLNMDTHPCPARYNPIDPVSPEKWLGYFLNARYVVTNSFHGTAFSAIFQKDFTVCMHSNQGRNTRLSQLLHSLHLEQRASAPEESIVPTEVDYTLPKWAMQQLRDDGMEYLRQMLADIDSAEEGV